MTQTRNAFCPACALAFSARVHVANIPTLYYIHMDKVYDCVHIIHNQKVLRKGFGIMAEAMYKMYM